MEWKNIEEEATNMDIIINATSLGLKYGNDFEQEFKIIKPNLVYYDIIYNPEETMMIKKFKKKKIQTYNGLDMFIYQGKKSFFIWNKIDPEFNQKLKYNIIAKLK